MAGTDIINFDYDPDQPPPSIVDVLKQMYQRMIDSIKMEEERAKSPDWEYRRIHITSKEIAEKMLSPDTPLDDRMLLEWSTFVGYQWVHKDEGNVFTDDSL